MGGCAEFFLALDEQCERDGTARMRGDRVRANGHAVLLEWEREPASEHSPGPVARDERLRRALFERDLAAGVLHRLAFNSLDAIGFSVDRCVHSPLADSSARAMVKAANSGQATVGYLEIKAADFRNQVAADDAGNLVPAIGIYDTAISENRSHAEAFLLIRHSGTRPFKSIAADLMEMYRGRITAWSADSSEGS